MKTVPTRTTLNAAPTLGQITKLIRNIGSPKGGSEIENLIKRLHLDREGVQRLLLKSDGIIPALAEGRLLIEVLETLSFPNEFADEVESNYGYLSGYTRPKSLAEQIAKLYELFPSMAARANRDLLMQIEKDEITLPYGAEGFFAIPHYLCIADSYQEAVQKVLDRLKEVLGDRFANCRKGYLGPNLLHENRKKIVQRGILQKDQDSDMHIVAAQFGMRHRGRSGLRAHTIMNKKECGLGAYEIGIMLLTHPERLQNKNDLWIDCIGDEYYSLARDGFLRSPVFRIFEDTLILDTHEIDRINEHFGSPSSFLL